MIKYLFIYSPLFGKTDETEKEKLLYFYPPDISSDEKMLHVGLSEGTLTHTIPHTQTNTHTNTRTTKT